MAGFKRNSGTGFQRRDTQAQDNGGGEERSSGSRPTSRGSSYQGRSSGGGKSYGSKKDSGKFVRIADLTLAKKHSEDNEVLDIVEALNGREVQMNASVWFPPGVESLTLRKKDRLLVSFMVHEKAKDFVRGTLSFIKDDNSNE